MSKIVRVLTFLLSVFSFTFSTSLAFTLNNGMKKQLTFIKNKIA